MTKNNTYNLMPFSVDENFRRAQLLVPLSDGPFIYPTVVFFVTTKMCEVTWLQQELRRKNETERTQ